MYKYPLHSVHISYLLHVSNFLATCTTLHVICTVQGVVCLNCVTHGSAGGVAELVANVSSVLCVLQLVLLSSLYALKV